MMLHRGNLVKRDEGGMQCQLKLRLSWKFCWITSLGDVLVLIPELRRQDSRGRVGIRIVAGELVAESPQNQQCNEGNCPRPE